MPKAATSCKIADEVDAVTRRWRFVAIAPDQFRWIGETSTDKGMTWMRARRRT